MRSDDPYAVLPDRVALSDCGTVDLLAAAGVAPALRAAYAVRLADAGLTRVRLLDLDTATDAEALTLLAHLAPRVGVEWTGVAREPRGVRLAAALGLHSVVLPATSADVRELAGLATTLGLAVHAMLPRGLAAPPTVGPSTTSNGASGAAPDAVGRVVGDLRALGVREVTLGDVDGQATPVGVRAVLGVALPVAPDGGLSVRLSTKGGLCQANALTALACGVRAYETVSAPGDGTVTAADLVHLLDSLAVAHHVDRAELTALCGELDRALTGADPAQAS